MVIARSKTLRNRYRKPAANAHAESDDHEIDRPRRTYRRKRIDTKRLSDDDGVHHIIELLKKHSEKHRHKKLQDQL